VSLFDQAGFTVRMGWASELGAVASDCPVVVIVDVLRFSTCVSVACARGAAIVPSASPDLLRREDGGWSLSPTDIGSIPAGTRLVLPSPNGSALAVQAAGLSDAVYAGCVRNASAVARAVAGRGRPIAVIAASERGRPGVEDLIGAGAVIAALWARPSSESSAFSPEARAARAAYESAELPTAFLECGSGRELAGQGWTDDILCAAEIDADDVAPLLVDGAFRA